MRRSPTILLITLLPACGLTISDGIDPKEIIDVDLTTVASTGRQEVLRAGGMVWGVGYEANNSLAIWRGSLGADRSWEKRDLLQDAPWSSFSRLVLAAHPTLNTIYLGGGIYDYPVQSNSPSYPELPDMGGARGVAPTIPSLQAITQSNTDLPITPGNGAYIIHPAAAQLSAENLPPSLAPRQWHNAVWSGSAMYIVGGADAKNDQSGIFNGQPPFLADGGGYLADTRKWIAIADDSNGTNTTLATAVWADGAVWVVGGLFALPDRSGGGTNACATNQVKRYDPTSDSWQAGSTLPGLTFPAPSGCDGNASARVLHSTVWTGTQLLVWGGVDCLDNPEHLSRTPCQDAFFYGNGLLQTPANLISGTSWSLDFVPGPPPPRAGHTAVWTGNEMIVWGGFDATGDLNDGATLQPDISWAPLPSLNAPIARSGHSAVWAPELGASGQMLVWGGTCTGCETGGRYGRTTDTWQSMSATNAPAAREMHAAVWTGTHLIIWGGLSVDEKTLADGASYDPTTDSWSTLTTENAPADRYGHTAIWTGAEMIIFGGSSIVGMRNNATSVVSYNDGAAYDPATDSWSRLPFLFDANAGIAPFDPLNNPGTNPTDGGMNGQNTGANAGMTPLALATYETGGNHHLIAFLPHGKPLEAASTSGRLLHHRTLAFFRLDAAGLPIDHCPAVSGSEELAWTPDAGIGPTYFQATTEPAWVIELPDAAFAGTDTMPLTLQPGSTGMNGNWSRRDPRLYAVEPPNDAMFSCDANLCPPDDLSCCDVPANFDPGCVSNCDGQNPNELPSLLFKEELMPAAPKIIIDEQNERGYLFLNRWMGGVEEQGVRWLHPFANQTDGHALLVSFSLTAPALGACDGAGRTYASPFAGLFASDTSAAVDTARLEATAGVEPMLLLGGFLSVGGQNNSGRTDLDELFKNPIPSVDPFQNQDNCAERFAADPGTFHIECWVDAVPYQPFALDTARNQVIITQTNTDTILFLDGADLSAQQAVAVGDAPVSIAIDNTQLYVANRDSGTLSVVDLTSRTKTKEVSLLRKNTETAYPVGLHVDAVTGFVYVLNLGVTTISVYDPAKEKLRFIDLNCYRPAEMFVDTVERKMLIDCKGTFHYPSLKNNGFSSSETIAPSSLVFDLLD